MRHSLMARLVFLGIVAVILGLVMNAAISALLGPVMAAYLSISISVVLTLLASHFLLIKPSRSVVDYLYRCTKADSSDIDLPQGVDSKAEETAHFIRDQHNARKEMVESGGRIAIAAAEVSFAADTLKRRVHEQIEHVDEIGRSATSIAQTVEVAANTSESSVETAQLTRKASYIGQEYIQDASQQMQTMQGNVEGAAELISHLENKTNQIQEISKVINGIAEQTNLLALNAAIEAARAGDQGRGFAVVADEVRNLAGRTGEATMEIATMIQEIDEETQRVVTQMGALIIDVKESRDRTEKVDTQLEEILGHSRSVESQILEVAAGDKANHEHVEQITESIHQVSDHLSKTEAEVSEVSNEALDLSEHAELIYELLAGSSVDTIHDQIRLLAQEGASAVGCCFEEAVASGQISVEDLFDRDYQPIPDTNPSKYKTRFDEFTDRVLPPIQEPLLERFSFTIYAGAVDDNGYFPTHNNRYCQTLTGDPKVDLVNNRTKRMFNDRTGLRCAKNTKAFLLQTYKRDTGEVMHDMSAPIVMNGRHWGGFRIGYKANTD